MVRIKRGNVAAKRRKKLRKRAKGFRGSLRTTFRTSKQAVTKAMTHATRHRKERKREMRSLWIIRINAVLKSMGLSYGKFMHGLKKANININRKMLADLAVRNADAFSKLVEKVKG